MEQFNPCLRNFIAMGKSYEKALTSEYTTVHSVPVGILSAVPAVHFSTVGRDRCCRFLLPLLITEEPCCDDAVAVRAFGRQTAFARFLTDGFDTNK